MFRRIFLLAFVIVLTEQLVYGCLITNCPRGGKRSNSIEAHVKPCVSCGPNKSGQCFGPSICCGPFGCLFGTPETIKCRRDGNFLEREPCTAGNGSCRRNTGRCAAEGVCCTQESCHTDASCQWAEKPLSNMVPVDVYNLYPLEYLEK